MVRLLRAYHVPEKELLLQYATEEFYEETPEVTAMRAVFADMGMSPARQESELKNYILFAQENAELPEVFDDIQRRKLTFNDRTLACSRESKAAANDCASSGKPERISAVSGH